MAERKKIGELLVEGKVITQTQLTSALAHQRQWGGRLGSALIEKGFLTEDVLAKFLSFQLNFPSVSLTKIQIQQEVLARVPRDMQEKHLCVPIAVMKEGRTNSLILAIADPTDVRAIDEIGFATGLKVKPVIATESALKKVLYGAQTGGVRNVALATPSGFHTVHEPTDEFEVVRGVTNTGTGPSAPPVSPGAEARQPQAMGVVGEETIDFGESDIVLEPTEVEPEPAVVAGRIATPAAGKADPFAAAVIARASGAPAPAPAKPAPAMPAPTPMVMGTPIATGPIPGGAPVVEGSLPTLDPGALAPVATSLSASSAGAVPSNGFETEDRTEPDIVMAGGSPPAVPEPEPEPQPEAWQPEAEALPADETSALLDAWGEPPPPPQSPTTTEEIVATGAIPTEEGMPEISLPGPEMLPPPAEILESPVPDRPPVDTPSRIFRVPEDMLMAEASLPVPEPPPPPAAAPAEPADEAWAPAAESWEPAPETWAAEAPAAPAAEPAAATFDPGMESGFEPTVPDSEMEAPPPAVSLDPPMEMAPEMPPEKPAGTAPEMPADDSVSLSVEDTFVPAPPEPQPEPEEPLAADGGGVPQSLDPATEHSDDNEKTVIGMGAMEPTWTGEKPLAERNPEKTVLGLGASEPMWTDSSTTEERPRPDREPDRETSSDRETVESFELPPPKRAPPPAAKLEPPKPAAPPPVAPPPPSQEKTLLKPPAVKVDAPEAAESSEPSRPPSASAGISDEQAALNATVTKKLKLLNAIAELLLEKGLITEDEIKEKISKKK